MPKIVNHEARRRELARVVWRLMAREGIDAVTIRAVAREAGLSHGAVQYYFGTHKELLVFAMDIIVDGSGERLDAIDDTDAESALLAALLALAPLDADSTAATRLWVEMFTRSLTDVDFRRINRTFNTLLAETIMRLLTRLAAQCGPIASDVVAAEAVRLHALFDGACVHAVTDPQLLSADQLRELLRDHITQLTARWRDGP